MMVDKSARNTEHDGEQSDEGDYYGPLNLSHTEIAILAQLVPEEPPDRVVLREGDGEHYANLYRKVHELKHRAGW